MPHPNPQRNLAAITADREAQAQCSAGLDIPTPALPIRAMRTRRGLWRGLWRSRRVSGV